MKLAGKLNLVAGAALLLSAVSLRAEESQPASANPYSTITARNVFALVPIPTNPPVDTTPPDPPIKLTPNGIMNVFGQLEVIFKAAVPAKGKEAAHDQSYVLAEGEREDDIEVVKIDDKASVISFINHGIKQDLPLADAPTVTSPAASPGGLGGLGGPGGGVPMPRGIRPGAPNFNNGGVAGDRPNRRNATDGNQLNNNASGGLNGGLTGGGNFNTPGNANTEATDASNLTPEQQVVAIEQERARLLDANSPTAPLMPITPLTKQVIGGTDVPGSDAPTEGNK